MLDGYGIHTLIWDSADDRLGDFLVASPADASGRGLELHVRQGGAAADLTGASVYFLWRHKMAGTRGCEPMEAVDATLGVFQVYYPAAMQEAEGAVDAQCMVSWDDKSISTRAFAIRVEPVIVGGTESEDGFTLFVEAIKRYEGAIEVTTEAADAANAAAEAAMGAAGAANLAATTIQQVAEGGEFDGADGFSSTATVTQTSEGATITITDANGTTTANVAKGAKGDTGETGPQGPQGVRGPQGIQGETGPAGASGTEFTPVSPLSLSNGELSVDLSGVPGESDIHPRLWCGSSMPAAKRGGMVSGYADRIGLAGVAQGDWVMNPARGTLMLAETVSGNSVQLRGLFDLSGLRDLVPTTALDLAAGETGSAWMNVYGPPVLSGTLILNTSTGALMRATSDATPSSLNMGYATVSAVGLGNVFGGGGASYTASSPLAIDASNDISIDLSAYATQSWVNTQISNAIAALDDLSEEEF